MSDPTKSDPFPPTSRYHDLGVEHRTGPNGQTVVYVRRRIVPSPDRYALLQDHIVVQGDRLDLLAARYLGDPEQFWRICDANGAIRPDELIETPQRHLRITLPEGVPGFEDA